MCTLYAEKSGRELVILIDALDQLFLDEIRNGLYFIPTNLSGKVKIVCSFLDNFETGYHKKWEQEEQLLSLNEKDKEVVINGIIHSQGRELSHSVIEKITKKQSSDNPLYLSLAVQRLVMMNRDDFEKITTAGDGMRAITELQLELIDELSDNLGEVCMDILFTASRNLGGNLTAQIVKYIAVSRYGLREKDLEGIFED